LTLELFKRLRRKPNSPSIVAVSEDYIGVKNIYVVYNDPEVGFHLWVSTYRLFVVTTITLGVSVDF